MKATTKRIDDGRKINLFVRRRISIKQLLMMILVICFFNSKAQKAKSVITISGAQFTSSLVGKWISEYTKINPEAVFKFVKSSSQNKQGDLNLIVNTSALNDEKTTENQTNVGRLAILPVANEKNSSFAKQLKNGIKQDELKNIFLKKEIDLSNDEEEEKTVAPSYTVYTQTLQSASAKVWVSHFGTTSSELNGVIVTGEDKYLVESVLEDSTGVTYGNLGVVYDLNSRTPLSGIKIIPIDPDNNGRLKKEELIYDNIDQLITYLETSNNRSIPTAEISLSYDSKNNNPLVADFVNWVVISGQAYNQQFGFLKTDRNKDRTLTQK